MFHSYVVRARISPRLRDLESLAHRPRHELQLHPLAPLFEVLESLALTHRQPASFAPKEKARPMGRASSFKIFTLYSQYINLNRVNPPHFAELYLRCREQLRLDRMVLAY